MPRRVWRPVFPIHGSKNSLQRAMRLELTTPTLATWCSTTELRPHDNTQSIYAAPNLCNPFFDKNFEVSDSVSTAILVHTEFDRLAGRRRHTALGLAQPVPVVCRLNGSRGEVPFLCVERSDRAICREVQDLGRRLDRLARFPVSLPSPRTCRTGACGGAVRVVPEQHAFVGHDLQELEGRGLGRSSVLADRLRLGFPAFSRSQPAFP
jgi:hypothetical protein